MPKKPTIAVDIDEVLFPMAPTFLEYHNSNHGTAFTVDQMTSYYVENLTGETVEEVIAKIKAYLKTEHYSLGQPIPGSLEAIKALREHYRLVLITARNDFYRGHTEDFIEKHFTGLFDELRYTHTLENPETTVPKSVICKETGAIALIDDHLYNVRDAAQAGIRGILFGNYPWNAADELPDGVTRCVDWPAVLEHFHARS
jgi:uncharacterized HAD superfamily protein